MAHPFDSLTADAMRAGGSWKWSTPGTDAHGRGLIGAFVAEMDFPPAPAVAEAVRACADGNRFGYLSDAWVAEMADACAAFWSDRFGYAVDPAWIRPLPDVLTALTSVVEHFTPPGSPVLLPTPAYMPFLTVPGMLGRELVRVPMAHDGGSWSLDLDVLDAAFASSGSKLLVLTNPHNPTGRVLTEAELAAVTAVVGRHGARVFADEIHAPLTFDGRVHRPYAASSETAAAHTLTATSASKAWNLPGLKCGQLILSNSADAARWTEVGYLAEHGTATPGVLASTAAYRDGREWLDDVLGYLDGNRALLRGTDLPGLSVTVPEGTYLAWLDATGLGLDEPPSAFFAREAGVVMTDGAACAGPGGMRLNLAMARPVLADALERISAALA
ncbi:aminotransferase class I/II-fold pyridoxal phosphate-dependent enzyme [Actinomycetospora endophytica]|uniref:cysteine-S-conjugate beta-lyase n=1 Tax=Actinomycetospora endophytica TaxID=2291215 RepID=A0ABS8PB51_9PSEU|nr:aminotransferase class I/II-fold pyridoxal phosphate-dependent enzyme [Actinomycetospora endophytica]MCD2195505.1 aminotransferase class I/II-fold pyridoxal phosphate-dependent enzyme [Actinomycetospora endophytica]